jgi:predicted nucleotide-binding protein
MWHIQVPSLIGSFPDRWELLKDTEDDLGDHIDLCLYLNRFVNRLGDDQVLEVLDSHLHQAQVDWLKPRGGKWELDLDELRRESPELRKLGWLHGVILIQPEVKAIEAVPPINGRFDHYVNLHFGKDMMQSSDQTASIPTRAASMQPKYTSSSSPIGSQMNLPPLTPRQELILERMIEWVEDDEDGEVIYLINSDRGFFRDHQDVRATQSDIEQLVSKKYLHCRAKTNARFLTVTQEGYLYYAGSQNPQGGNAVNSPAPVSVDKRKVFVAYGQDEGAKEALFTFLRAADLQPMEWGQVLNLAIQAKGQGSPYVGDVLETGMRMAQAVVILFTGEEIANLLPAFMKPDEEAKPQIAQPRPNVIFEAGMAIGKYPERTVIVEMGRVRDISDITGRHVVRLDNSTEKREALLDRLTTIGCAVQKVGGAWQKAGNLS